MPDILEHRRSLGNGKDGPQLPFGIALGNTVPLATRGSTFGAGAPVSVKAGADEQAPIKMLGFAEYEFAPEQTIVVQVVSEPGPISLYVRSVEGTLQRQAPQKTYKPAGQVVLFKKVMEQWGFDEREASTLLGFEDATDIRDIYEGRKLVGQRDANDRLRAVLRIAADIDALLQDGSAIRDWLNEPQKDLGGQTPRALLNEGSMENLLKVKYYVSYLSGR